MKFIEVHIAYANADVGRGQGSTNMLIVPWCLVLSAIRTYDRRGSIQVRNESQEAPVPKLHPGVFVDAVHHISRFAR